MDGTRGSARRGPAGGRTGRAGGGAGRASSGRAGAVPPPRAGGSGKERSAEPARRRTPGTKGAPRTGSTTGRGPSPGGQGRSAGAQGTPAGGRAKSAGAPGKPAGGRAKSAGGQGKSPGGPGKSAGTAGRSGAAKAGTGASQRSSPQRSTPRTRSGHPVPPPVRSPRPRRPPRSRARRRWLARAGDPDRRSRAALIIALFVFSLFGGRLIQLQGLDASALAAQALDQRLVMRELPAHRGNITDASGVVLATTVERRNITVDQTMIGLYEHRVGGRMVTVGARGAAQDLAPVLGLSVRVLQARLTGTARFAYVAKDVTPEVARQVSRLAITGIFTEQASRRSYPAGQVAANVLGFVGSDGRAWGGIEGEYDAALSGRPGSITYEHGMDGAEIPTGVAREVDPQNGSSIRLTIDRDLQFQAQRAMQEQVKATGAEAGYLVAMDPRTGAVLALVSVPTFDPNNPGASSVADRSDGALLDVFEPGSTQKVVTMAAALEEGTTTPRTHVTVPPTLRRAGTTFHDAETHGTLKLTTAGVLTQSSNIGTIKVGEKVPPSKLYAVQRRFGLGQRTGIGLAESGGILAPSSRWSGSQRYTVLFGQGLSVTALQAASVFATIANDGVRVAPQLVAGTTGPDGTFHPAPAPARTRAVSTTTARQVRLMMENVVGEHGTAVKASIPGYRVAGKTGTAQAPDAKCGCYRGYTASFIGMAPADAPRLVVAVVLQRPTKGHYGGQVAAPVFQQVMTDALTELKVPPTGTKAPVMPLTWR